MIANENLNFISFTEKQFPKYASIGKPNDYGVSTFDFFNQNVSTTRYSFKTNHKKQVESTDDSENPEVVVVYVVVGIAGGVVILLVCVVFILFKRKSVDDYRLIKLHRSQV